MSTILKPIQEAPDEILIGFLRRFLHYSTLMDVEVEIHEMPFGGEYIFFRWKERFINDEEKEVIDSFSLYIFADTGINLMNSNQVSFRIDAFTWLAEQGYEIKTP